MTGRRRFAGKGESVKRWRALLVGIALFGSAAAFAGTPEEEVRAAFERFVAVQNAHDAKAVEALLLDSPRFLWITRGTAVWGRTAAVERFTGLYAGTWRLAPELDEFRVVLLRPDLAQIYVPIRFSIGAAGQPAPETRFLMNMVLVETGAGWKVASILPIPVPAPPKTGTPGAR